MTTRPIASLSPTLLARKGAARPAMRPQIQPLRAFQESTARQLDDLGWNDMGNDAGDPQQPEMAAPAPAEAFEPQQTAEIVTLVPPVELAAELVIEPVAVAVPEVVRQQEVLSERVKAEPIVETGRIEPAKPRQSALSSGRRAAFTLRLDAERHLKLRLASVTSNRSAQQLVTEALDRLIAELPDVAELAAQVRKPKS